MPQSRYSNFYNLYQNKTTTASQFGPARILSKLDHAEVFKNLILDPPDEFQANTHFNQPLII